MVASSRTTMARAGLCRVHCRQAGFTLIELMIVVMIAAILAALATPSFKSLIVRQRIKTASADLVSHLTLSRSEAIKQNSDVTIASASNNNSWANGWSITSAGGTVGTHGAFVGLTISTGVGGLSSLVFNRSGRLNTSSASTSFQIGDATSGSAVTGRCVRLGLTGLATSADGSC